MLVAVAEQIGRSYTPPQGVPRSRAQILGDGCSVAAAAGISGL